MFYLPGQTRRREKVRRHAAPLKWARQFLAVLLAAAPLSIGLLNGAGVQAAAGGLDPSFGSGGRVVTNFSGGEVYATAVQPDGKILAAGSIRSNTPPLYHEDFAVARYNSDGSLDDGTAQDSTPGDSFGDGGKVVTDFFGSDDSVAAIILQPDGKFVAGGHARDRGLELSAVFALARYNSDGSLDTSFGDGGKVTGDFPSHYSSGANAIALQPDGKIVAIGANRNIYFTVVRYNSDGSLDDGTAQDSTPGDSFGDGGKVFTDASHRYAQTVAIQSDGKLLVGGGNFMLRYNSNGSLDAGFGNLGVLTLVIGVSRIVVQPDGKILIAGGISPDPPPDYQSDLALARYHSDGRLDTRFGQEGKASIDFFDAVDYATEVLIQVDGKIVAVGVAERPGVGDRVALARFKNNGVLDPSFGSGGKLTTDIGNQYLFQVAAALQPDGKIVVASYTSPRAFALLRYLNDASSIIPLITLETKFQVLLRVSQEHA